MKITVRLTRDENIKYYGKEEVELDLEEYLKGVVPSEIGNAHIEACAAQAVAARNFAVIKINAQGFITDKSSSDQAFRTSRLTGYPNAYAGVEKTKGELLYYNNRIAKCYYSSSNGGQTTSSEERWGGKYAYLISQPDPYDNGNGNGHGIGLSQLGAKNRAAAGHTYKEILAFYFPGTILKGEEDKMTIEKFILQWIQEKEGNPYIYGATQKQCTVSYRQERMQQYPDYAENIFNNCIALKDGANCIQCKWYDKITNTHKYAYDCAQFIRWAASAAGLPSVKSGATSQWKSDIWQEKGNFSNVPNDKLCCVFRDKDGIKQHVGWYYNGIAYHAQGHATGVVKTNNKQYKAWTHYAIMNGIYNKNGEPIEMSNYNNDLETKPRPTPEVYKVLYQAQVKSSVTKLNIRKEPDKKSDRVVYVYPNDILDVLEIVNNEWWKVAYNKYIGYVASEYIEKINNTKDDDGSDENQEKDDLMDFYIKIKCNSEEEAQLIVDALSKLTIVLE